MIQDKVITIKSIAEVELASILMQVYLTLNKPLIEKKIKEFLKKRLPELFKIPSYFIYQELVDIEFDKLYYNFFKSLEKLNQTELLTRARLDTTLLINLPSNFLMAIDKIKKNKNVFKSEEEEEDYSIGLILLFPEILLVDSASKKYNNQQLAKLKKNELNVVDKNKVDSKKKFKKYKKEVANNRTSGNKTKLVKDTSLTFNSIIAKKIFFKDVWICSFLANSRPAHKNANRQKRGVDGFFVVGGERFRYAGDWAFASVGNVINCRCYISNDY
jgi:hypothetical protein